MPSGDKVNRRRDEPARSAGRFRSLAWFWAVVLLVLGVTTAGLQILGPPVLDPAVLGPPTGEASLHGAKVPQVAAMAHSTTAEPATHPVASAATPPVAPFGHAAEQPEPTPPGTITRPDPALLEPATAITDGWLPRIGADKRLPRQIYAAAFNTADQRPRIGILVAGIGVNAAESKAAMAVLPAAVSVAMSPYAADIGPVADEARARGHELLVSIPMEPQGFPINDPGNRALLTGITQAANAQRLEWVLTRFAGYVGATGALGDMRGERFAAASDQMAPVLETLAARGLLYVDPRPNVPRLTLANNSGPRLASRTVDMVLDDPPGAAEIDQRLARLEQMAKDRGSALALAGRPTPVMADRIATWALGLETRGLVLAPVSAIVQMPQAGTVSSRVPAK